jgi:carboxypeptidase C (cathepsin A)
LRGHLTGAYYESGHMVYAHMPSLAKLKQDTAEFIRASSGTTPGK